MPKPTDREADYMCFSPLRGKTSELEGEEEYISRLVSRNLQRTINYVRYGNCCPIPTKNVQKAPNPIFLHVFLLLRTCNYTQFVKFYMAQHYINFD
jgi:hypothetical protein